MGFLNSLLSALRDIHTSNQDLAQAIRANTESGKGAKEPPVTSAPLPFQLPEAITSYYESEQKDRPGNSKWKRLERIAAGIAFVLSVLAAIFTYRTVHQVTRQADIAQAEFNLSERPWLAVTGIDIDRLVVNPDSPIFRLDYRIVNFGHGIASLRGIHAVLYTEAQISRDVPGNVCQRPDPDFNDRWGILPTPEQPFLSERSYGPSSMKEFEGRKQIQPTITKYDPSTPTTVRIEGCLFYDSRTDKMPHHTRFMAVMSRKDAAGKCPDPNRWTPIIFSGNPTEKDVCVPLVWTRGEDSN